MNNEEWFAQLSARVRRPRFGLGQSVVVTPLGSGVIHSVYYGLMAAHNALLIPAPEVWWRMQEHQPHTPIDGIWYGVLLQAGGDILVGEDDFPVEPEETK